MGQPRGLKARYSGIRILFSSHLQLILASIVKSNRFETVLENSSGRQINVKDKLFPVWDNRAG